MTTPPTPLTDNLAAEGGLRSEMSAIVPPQKWCGQNQPHSAHPWTTRDGFYANCGGHS